MFHDVHRQVAPFINKLISQSANQSINQSINRSSKQNQSQSISQSSSQLLGQSLFQSVSQSVMQLFRKTRIYWDFMSKKCGDDWPGVPERLRSHKAPNWALHEVPTTSRNFTPVAVQKLCMIGRLDGTGACSISIFIQEHLISFGLDCLLRYFILMLWHGVIFQIWLAKKLQMWTRP